MKLGKIFSYLNKEEAKYLIGKKVLATDLFYLLENPTEKHPKLGILKGFTDEEGVPFNVALSSVDLCAYQFIREIEEEPTLMTNKQLAEWLARGFGECSLCDSSFCMTSGVSYEKGFENTPIGENLRIRPWGSDKWIKPTLEIYERDCKGKVDDKAKI